MTTRFPVLRTWVEQAQQVAFVLPENVLDKVIQEQRALVNFLIH